MLKYGRTPVVFVVMQTGNRANGGVESITQVLEQLRGTRAIVVSQLETEFNQRWQKAGADVHVWRLPYAMGSAFCRATGIAKARRLLSLVLTNVAIAVLLCRVGARVVHCNDELALWHCALGARIVGAKVVQNIRDIKDELDAYGGRWKIATRLSSHTLFLSREMLDAFDRRVFANARSSRNLETSFIYSIVNPSCFRELSFTQRQELRRRLGIDDDQFAVGYVAAFNRKKAQDNFLEKGVALLRASVPQGRVYFLGDFAPNVNEYAEICVDIARTRGLESMITFAGYMPNMAEWYQSLDVVVVGSRNEGLARCMIESLAAGTPVVSFEVCSAKEILHDHDCGVVVPQGDYKKMVEALKQLAENAPERQRLGGNGAALARELFDPERVVSQYESLYQRLHNTSSRSRAA